MVLPCPLCRELEREREKEGYGSSHSVTFRERESGRARYIQGYVHDTCKERELTMPFPDLACTQGMEEVNNKKTRDCSCSHNIVKLHQSTFFSMLTWCVAYPPDLILRAMPVMFTGIPAYPDTWSYAPCHTTNDSHTIMEIYSTAGSRQVTSDDINLWIVVC